MSLPPPDSGSDVCATLLTPAAWPVTPISSRESFLGLHADHADNSMDEAGGCGEATCVMTSGAASRVESDCTGCVWDSKVSAAQPGSPAHAGTMHDVWRRELERRPREQHRDGAPLGLSHNLAALCPRQRAEVRARWRGEIGDTRGKGTW